MSAIHFLLSALCIGVASTCIELLFVGYLFHNSQALTPQTWRPETSRSYVYSTVLSFIFGVLFTLFYIKIGSKYVIRGNTWSHIKLGLICFGCFTLVREINSAIYTNYDRKFTAGVLLASCVTYVAAAELASLFCWK